MITILGVAAAAMMAGAAAGPFVTQQRVMRGELIQGQCPLGETMVRMFWGYNPDFDGVRFRQSPGMVARCTRVAEGLLFKPGDVVVLGTDEHGRFSVLALDRPR